MTSATELAQAVRDERIEFDDALLEYLIENHPDRLDLSFFMVVKTAIGYAAMGNFQKDIPLSENETLTVQQVIDKFGLGPFVQPESEET